MSGERFRISYSKVASFDRCRKQFWFTYVSGLPRPENPMNAAGITGTGIHRAMKVLCDTGEPIDAANALDTYLRMPDHAVAGPGTDTYTTAFGLLERGIEAHTSLASEDRWAEMSTAFPYRDTYISARLDRADRFSDGRWQLVDWKTGRTDMDDQTDLQLDIGHLALRTTRRLPREANVTAVAWNLRSGRKRVRALRRDDAAATARLLAGIARRMQGLTEYVATPSPACGFCEWRPQCPEAEYVEAGEYDWLDPDDFDDAEFAQEEPGPDEAGAP
jgi:hypothetical protein